MICGDCRAKPCNTCNAQGVVEVQTDPQVGSPEPFPCDDCKSKGSVSDHDACKERNADKQPADCDCQHRE